MAVKHYHPSSCFSSFLNKREGSTIFTGDLPFHKRKGHLGECFAMIDLIRFGASEEIL